MPPTLVSVACMGQHEIGQGWWREGVRTPGQTGLYSPQGETLLNLLQEIGVELVQRFEVRKYETFQSFRHGVLFADCALEPLGKRGTSQR